MVEGRNSGYGQGKINTLPYTSGKVFIVSVAGDPNFNAIDRVYSPDEGGLARRYSTIPAALAATVAGRGDLIVLSPAFTTAPTAADVLLAETNGVAMFQAAQNVWGEWFVNRAAAALPQSVSAPIFTVTGRVKILNIIGQVTTAVQAQATTAKLTAVPTVGSNADICATGDLNAAAVGTQLYITGTFATALQINATGAQVPQAAPVIVDAGTLNLVTVASSTGAIKWKIIYKPIDPGAAIFAA